MCPVLPVRPEGLPALNDTTDTPQRKPSRKQPPAGNRRPNAKQGGGQRNAKQGAKQGAKKGAKPGPNQIQPQQIEGKRPFYLHIGVHKTGTTALQKFLHDNRAGLTGQGLYRIETGVPADNAHSWGNHELAWTLRDGDSKGLWQQVAQEAAPHQAVVASSEEFSSIKQARRYAPVRAAITDFAVRPICYLRRQDQLLESTYNYHVKSLGETKSIMEFAERIMKRLEFDQMLRWVSVNFSDPAVILRVYDPARLKGDIFDDFLDAIGLPDAAASGLVKPKATLNAGLTREGLDRMLEANRALHDNPDKLARQRRKILSDYAAPTWNEHEILTPDERRAVLHKFRPGNAQVARRFLNRPHLF